MKIFTVPIQTLARFLVAESKLYSVTDAAGEALDCEPQAISVDILDTVLDCIGLPPETDDKPRDYFNDRFFEMTHPISLEQAVEYIEWALRALDQFQHEGRRAELN